MRPTDPWYAESLGLLLFFLLMVAVAVVWAFGMAVRDTVREHRHGRRR